MTCRRRALPLWLRPLGLLAVLGAGCDSGGADSPVVGDWMSCVDDCSAFVAGGIRLTEDGRLIPLVLPSRRSISDPEITWEDGDPYCLRGLESTYVYDKAEQRLLVDGPNGRAVVEFMLSPDGTMAGTAPDYIHRRVTPNASGTYDGTFCHVDEE